MNLEHTALGIELGSTRIKAVLISTETGAAAGSVIAGGAFDWENRLENGVWTYDLDDVWAGVRGAFAALASDLKAAQGIPFTTTGAIGVSAMMHGYLVFDSDGKQLVPFRTWRNTNTGKAAAVLTDRFNFNVPQRWAAAHLYHAFSNAEEHTSRIAFMTTLAGYVHWKLTGGKVIGIGDASGIFPIDSLTGNYDAAMIRAFDDLVSIPSWSIAGILPKVLPAGCAAGTLTADGARLLDPSGTLASGIPLCPPEGDAGTGMVATNAVALRTGNVSAGTSVFAMVVLDKALSAVHSEIDLVTTPAGAPVAMVHCNNCTGDLDAWAGIFREAFSAAGAAVPKAALYDILYHKALEGDEDCGGVLSYNYFSGEPITGMEAGRPLLLRVPDARFTLANFARSLVFSAVATLKLGMDILTEKEGVTVEKLCAHGGFFKTPGVAQKLLAAALKVPVAVMESAGEGGPWGMALLAFYMLAGEGKSLETFLDTVIFAGNRGTIMSGDSSDIAGFSAFIARYTRGLGIEKAAVEYLK